MEQQRRQPTVFVNEKEEEVCTQPDRAYSPLSAKALELHNRMVRILLFRAENICGRVTIVFYGDTNKSTRVDTIK